MKKILVTGATGFIGNHVIASLLQHNCEVVATSSNGEKAKNAPWYKDVNYIPFNLEHVKDNVNYPAYFSYPQAMIHLAWEGLPNYKDPFHFEVNLPRHYTFLKNFVSYGLTDITVTGTCLEYGLQEGNLTESMETFPSNWYAIAKDTLRRRLQQLKKEESFDLKWIRLFYMFGSGQNMNSLLSQLDKALLNGEQEFNMSGGEQERDYLPVEKVAEYIAQIALQNNVTGIINCCSGVTITVKAFVENYLSKINRHIKLNLGYYPYTDYEPMSFWGDNKKLKAIINKNGRTN